MYRDSNAWQASQDDRLRPLKNRQRIERELGTR